MSSESPPGGPERGSAGTSYAAITRRDWVWLIGICCVGLLLRLLHVGQTWQFPTVIQPIGDSRGYLDWADQIAAGDWYGSVSFYQAPLYPYFLGVLRAIGLDVGGIRIVQVLLGTTAIGLIGFATYRLFGDRRAALVASAMLAIYPPAIYYDALIQKAALASFLLCCFLAVLVEIRHLPRVWVTLLCGITLGLLVLTRENALLWLPIPALWIWFGLRNELKGRTRWVHMATYAAGLALILLPVSARNASLGGEWSPTTFQAGPNFYIGNNAEANGVYSPLVPGHETPLYERSDAVKLAEEESGRELSAREVSQFWMRKAWSEISDAPARWLELILIKSLMAVNHYEVPDVESYTVYREQSIALLMFDRLWHFGVLAPLSLAGLILWRDHWRQHWVIGLLAITMFGAIILFFILGRYRQPLVPLLIPFAAVSVCNIWSQLRERRWKSVAVACLPAATLAVVCALPLHDVQTLDASSYMNVGVAAAQSGNVSASITLFRRALSSRPDMADAHFNLGRAMALSGSPREAISRYQRALELDPELVQTYVHLGLALEQLQNYQSANRVYAIAMEVDPSTVAAEGLARTAGMLGN